MTIAEVSIILFRDQHSKTMKLYKFFKCIVGTLEVVMLVKSITKDEEAGGLCINRGVMTSCWGAWKIVSKVREGATLLLSLARVT